MASQNSWLKGFGLRLFDCCLSNVLASKKLRMLSALGRHLRSLSPHAMLAATVSTVAG